MVEPGSPEFQWCDQQTVDRSEGAGMTRTRAQASLAESVVRALAEGDVLALQSLVAGDVVDHSAQPGQPTGWAGVRERAMTLCAALPESDVTVEILTADEDTVLTRAEITATGAALTPGADPTTTQVTVVMVLRFVDDLLSEMWTSSDRILDRAAASLR
jgi:predicted ester cyclase